MHKYVLHAVVSWQTVVRIAFDVAENKGASFENIADGGEFMSQLSELWEQDKQNLKQMTEAQARSYLEDRVSK